MDFVSKRKENYNTAQTTAMVDMDWRVSFPCPLIPKASLLQRLLSTFSDFNHRSLKNPVNPTVPPHSIKTSLHSNQLKGWLMLTGESYRSKHTKLA